MPKGKHLFCSSFVIVIFLASSSILAQKPSLASPTAPSISTQHIATFRNSIKLPKNVKTPENLSSKIAELKRKLSSAPDDAISLNKLSVLYFYSKRHEEALDALKQAVKLFPNSELYLNLSILYDHMNRFTESLGAVRRALELDPGNVRAKHQLCDLYLATGNFKRSSPCFRDLTREKTARPEYFSSYGISLIHQGRIKESVKVLQKAAEIFQNDPDVQNTLGLALAKKGKYKKALKVFEAILARDPKFVQARFNLAVVQLSMKNKSAAIKNYFVIKNANSPLAAKLYKFIYGDKILFVEDHQR